MRVFNQSKLKEALELIVHNSITTYKKKNTKATLKEQREALSKDKKDVKGGLFVVRSKEDFTSNGVKGYIVTSKEALFDDVNTLTHWTPNAYRKYQYTNDKRKYVCGFEEENLQQINTFVIDIDTKKYSVNDIVLTCMDDSIGVPTMIIESTRGYQVYFVLEQPIFISNKNNFRSLDVAKRISNNLKRSLKNVEADLFCNDFGFFRVPKKDNIVFFQKEQVYHAKMLIDWSMRVDDDLKRPLYVVPSKKSSSDISQSEWFYALLDTSRARGAKGELGRNNIMFTLALAYYHDGKSQEDAYNLLDVYNSNLQTPLQPKEVEVIVRSAYSGKYNGPKAEYVKELLELHVPNGDKISVNTGCNGWYKHKKDRSERVRSHYEEWEQDIVEYITVQKNDGEPFIQHTQKQLCEALDIPQSTLNVLIKQSKQIVRKVSGKGRGAITYWTTVELFMQHVIQLNKEQSETFIEYAEEIINKWHDTIEYNPASIITFDYLEKILKPPSDSGFERAIGGG